MNTFSKFVLLLSAFTLTTIISIQAQNTPASGTLGLRVNFTGQTTIEVPYMLNDELSLAPYFGLNSTEDQSTSFSIGVRPRFYINQTNALAPYVTGTLGLSNTSYSNSDNSITNFDLGIGYGAEYFFSDQFSVSADANLGTRFGDSASNISTAARVSASIYF